MDDCERGIKQSDRKRQNPDLPFDDKKKIKLMLYVLPFEMLDVILQKSYLHWILNSSTKPRDEEVIRCLISVDVCFNKRITRQRFKKPIWRYLKDLYAKTKRRPTIIRNNGNYLVNNIQPNDELMASLLHLNCITDEQSHFIQRHRRISESSTGSTRNKNYALLYAVKSFDEGNFANFVNCLRRTNQRTVAKIIENGGGVIKIQVRTRDAASMTTKINNLRDRTEPRSYTTDKLIAQLRDEGIEILSSQLEGQTVVVWILCHSQTAIENLQKLYESNQLRDKYFENIQPSISKAINIDNNQFKKTVVVCEITINVTKTIKISEHEEIRGVTKLRNEIYVLFAIAHLMFREIPRISVFEDRYPFRLQMDIMKVAIIEPWDIVSSEKENCLYVSDRVEKCVWKITRATDDPHEIIKWLTTDYTPRTMSLSRNDELLIINQSSPYRLMIYGSDAELIRSIPLTKDIKYPWHAVETSIGNFIIIDRQENVKDEDEYEDEDEDEDEEVDKEVDEEEEKDEDEEEEDEDDDTVIKEGKHTDSLKNRHAGNGGSNWLKREVVVSELTRDGQMVIRRFSPSDKTQQLNDCYYLFIDSDDRVFAADPENYRVILLDSDLKWNRILCGDLILNGKRKKQSRLFYDQEMKQLIVAGGLRARNQANFYTLSLN